MGAVQGRGDLYIMLGRTIAHYHILEKLGEGGMGAVWRAHDLRLDRDVALKVLPDEVAADPERKSALAQEAKAIAALDHPNIVTVYAVEEADGISFLSMELVRGRTLSEHIPEQGLTLDRFLELAVPLADALSAAHERGVIHCDLKPSNILLSDAGRVKVLDFGLAKCRPARAPGDLRRSTTQSDPTAPRDAGIAGTAGYMSPEQIRGQPLDHRSDIFSLGVVFHEMATGERPFQGETWPEIVAAVLRDEPDPVDERNPSLPHALALIIARCLEKDLRRRTQMALDLRNELEQLRRDAHSFPKAGGPSVAVLPFADLSREKDQEYFCEGMAEEIIHSLGRIQRLRVASRTSAFQFKSGGQDSREIGRRLGVGTLLEGSVRKSGERLRIAVQLTDARSGYQLWEESYDRELSDVFVVQEEIAHNIVQALQVALSPQERAALQKIATRDVEAYDCYLQGRRLYLQFEKRDVERARDCFVRAVTLDPGYALAFAGLADCWSYLYLFCDRSEPNRAQADAASRRAVELDPESAQAHASRGLALSFSGRGAEAVEVFEAALRLDPNLFEAYYFYARHCFANGEQQKAISLYEQAMRVRPEDYQCPLLVAQSYDDLGQPEKAQVARRHGVEIAQRQAALNPDDARAVYMAANGLVALGEKERGCEWARRALALRPEDSMVLYNVGCIFAMLGYADDALDCLEKAIRNGLSQKGWYDHDSNLDSLRGDPRFQKLMALLCEQVRPAA